MSTWISNLNGRADSRAYEWNKHSWVVRPPPGQEAKSLQASQYLANGEVDLTKHYCARSTRFALAKAGTPGFSRKEGMGNANQMGKRFEGKGWTRVPFGAELKPGDVAGYTHYGKPGGAGWKYGHVGIISTQGMAAVRSGARDPDMEPVRYKPADSPMARLDRLLEESNAILGMDWRAEYNDPGPALADVASRVDSNILTEELLALTDGMPEIQSILLWAYGGLDAQTL